MISLARLSETGNHEFARTWRGRVCSRFHGRAAGHVRSSGTDSLPLRPVRSPDPNILMRRLPLLTTCNLFPPVRIRPELVSLVLVVALAMVLPPGCRKKQPRPIKNEPLTVLATAYPLADVARRVGGRYVRVEWIAERGQPLAKLVPAPDLRARLGTVDLLLTSGASEPWAIEGFDDPFRAAKILRLDLLAGGGRSGGSETSLAPSQVQLPAGSLWLDPVLVRETAHETARRLALRRPHLQDYFTRQADTVAGEIDALLAEYQPQSGSREGKVLTLSNRFDPLLGRLGITPVRPLFASPGRLSSNELRQLRDAASAQRTEVLIVDADVPAAVVADLAARSGLRVITLDSLGSSAAGDRDTYLDLMRYNLGQLSQALAAPTTQPAQPAAP